MSVLLQHLIPFFCGLAMVVALFYFLLKPVRTTHTPPPLPRDPAIDGLEATLKRLDEDVDALEAAEKQAPPAAAAPAPPDGPPPPSKHGLL